MAVAGVLIAVTLAAKARLPPQFRFKVTFLHLSARASHNPQGTWLLHLQQPPGTPYPRSSTKPDLRMTPLPMSLPLPDLAQPPASRSAEATKSALSSYSGQTCGRGISGFASVTSNDLSR